MQASLYNEVIKTYHILHQVYDVLISPLYIIDTSYNMYDYIINKTYWHSRRLNYITIGIYNTNKLCVMIDENQIVYGWGPDGYLKSMGKLPDLSTAAKSYFILETMKKENDHKSLVNAILNHKCKPIYV